MRHLQPYNAFHEAKTSDKIYYHGRNVGRAPYRGTYIYITDKLEYAASYSAKGELYAFTLNVPESALFSIRNPKHRQKLARLVDEYTMESILSSCGSDELDWAILGYLSTDDYEEPEDLLQALGFRGVRLKERPYADSILMFNQDDLTPLGKVDMDTPEMIQRLGAWYKYIEANWSHL